MSDYQKRAAALDASGASQEFCEIATVAVHSDVYQLTIDIYEDETVYALIKWSSDKIDMVERVDTSYLYKNYVPAVTYYSTIQPAREALTQLLINIDY